MKKLILGATLLVATLAVTSLAVSHNSIRNNLLLQNVEALADAEWYNYGTCGINVFFTNGQVKASCGLSLEIMNYVLSELYASGDIIGHNYCCDQCPTSTYCSNRP